MARPSYRLALNGFIAVVLFSTTFLPVQGHGTGLRFGRWVGEERWLDRVVGQGGLVAICLLATAIGDHCRPLGRPNAERRLTSFFCVASLRPSYRLGLNRFRPVKIAPATLLQVPACATAVVVHSRRIAARKRLSVGCRAASMRRLVTLLARWPRLKHSSDRATTESALRCCLHISSVSCGLAACDCAGRAGPNSSSRWQRSLRTSAGWPSSSHGRLRCPPSVWRERAESMLHTLEGALRIFEKHRELILDQLNRPSA
jgi:hypothetical protein